MPEELYRIQDLCFQKDHSFLINHLDMYQYKGGVPWAFGAA